MIFQILNIDSILTQPMCTPTKINFVLGGGVKLSSLLELPLEILRLCKLIHDVDHQCEGS